MPPVARYKYGLTRVLHTFNNDWEPVGAVGSFSFLQSWQNSVKVLNRLVIFTLLSQVLTSNELLGNAWAWWHHDPALVALDARVPSGCAERVLMDFTARAPRSNQEPSVWRGLLLSQLSARNKC